MVCSCKQKQSQSQIYLYSTFHVQNNSKCFPSNKSKTGDLREPDDMARVTGENIAKTSD